MIKYPFQLILAIVIVFGFTSCDNEPLEGDFPDVINPNPTNPGTSTEPGEGSTGDYWPTAVGNIWVYETINADGSTNENDYEIIGESTVDGLPAFELDEFFVESQLDNFETATFEATGYIIKNEGNYSYYNPGFEFSQEGVQISLQPFGYIFFKDYLEAGETFTSTFTTTTTSSFDGGEFEPIELSVELDYVITVVERDFTLTINEETYENVIHIKLAYSYEDLEINQTIVGETEIYFAKDVGPIKLLDLNETEGFESDIISYDLN